MPITRKSISELISAADLDPNQKDVQTTLSNLRYPLDSKNCADSAFDIFDLFESKNRAVWVDWKARYDEVSQKFNIVLQHWGSEIEFTPKETKISEDNYDVASYALEYVNKRLTNKNVVAVEFNTDQDAFACLFFNTEKFEKINPDTIKFVTNKPF